MIFLCASSYGIGFNLENTYIYFTSYRNWTHHLVAFLNFLHQRITKYMWIIHNNELSWPTCECGFKKTGVWCSGWGILGYWKAWTFSPFKLFYVTYQLKWCGYGVGGCCRQLNAASKTPLTFICCILHSILFICFLLSYWTLLYRTEAILWEANQIVFLKIPLVL